MNQLNACRLIDNQTSDIAIADQRHEIHNEAEFTSWLTSEKNQLVWVYKDTYPNVKKSQVNVIFVTLKPN